MSHEFQRGSETAHPKLERKTARKAIVGPLNILLNGVVLPMRERAKRHWLGSADVAKVWVLVRDVRGAARSEVHKLNEKLHRHRSIELNKASRTSWGTSGRVA